MTLSRIVVPPNPARLIHAIASIGYDTEVALCDIIDNSVDANCTDIEVSITPVLTSGEKETDTISSFLIADDGIGMDRDGLFNAARIGSERTYHGESLGKFGLGLKSAALALGNRLTVISKTVEMTEPVCAIMSATAVMTENEYYIELGEPPTDLLTLWRRTVPNADHGTLVMVSELNGSTPAQNAFTEFFRRHCSITYHLLMSHGPKVSIKVNRQILEAIDPLFPEEADANGKLIPSEWSGRTVQRLLAPTKLEFAAGISGLVEATQIVHPPSFEADGLRPEKRDHYMVDRDPYTENPRHGFYVYRNNRIIVMAERFRGIVPSQTSSWAFRARLMFDERADEILNLDVKKRHCTLPRKARQNLVSLVKSYVALSADAWQTVGKVETKRKAFRREAVANESISDTAPSDLSYTSGLDPASHATADVSGAQLAKMGQAGAGAIQDESLSTEKLSELLASRIPVILTNGLRGNVMWMPYPAPEAGTATVLVNRYNTWVENAYAAADENSPLYVTLHHLFFILSRAEIEVRSNSFPGFTSDQAARVLDTFRRRVAAIAEDMADSLERTYSGLADGRFDDEEE